MSRALNRAHAMRRLARLEREAAEHGAGSWLGVLRANPPQPRTALLLPARAPGRRPGPEASPMARGLWQATAWHRARADAATKAEAEGRDPAAAVAAVGEVADFGVTRPWWMDPNSPEAKRQRPASASEAPAGSPDNPEHLPTAPRAPRDASDLTPEQRLTRWRARNAAQGRAAASAPAYPRTASL